MRTIPPESNLEHKCKLDSAKDYSEDTLAQCPECYRWYYKEIDYTFWVDHVWVPVRWYHFKKWERIRNFMEEQIDLL